MSYTPSSTSNTTNHRRTASAQHTRRESQLRHVINSSQSSHSHHSESSDSMTESEEHEMDPVQHRSHLDDDEETGLTSNVRRERSRRKRKNTGFDERVASSGESMLAMKEQSAEEASLTRRTLLYRILLNVMFIALWYTFSISISVVCTTFKGSAETVVGLKGWPCCLRQAEFPRALSRSRQTKTNFFSV